MSCRRLESNIHPDAVDPVKHVAGVELGADYSYTTHDVFDGINRIGVNVGF